MKEQKIKHFRLYGVVFGRGFFFCDWAELRLETETETHSHIPATIHTHAKKKHTHNKQEGKTDRNNG